MFKMIRRVGAKAFLKFFRRQRSYLESRINEKIDLPKLDENQEARIISSIADSFEDILKEVLDLL